MSVYGFVRARPGADVGEQVARLVAHGEVAQEHVHVDFDQLAAVATVDDRVMVTSIDRLGSGLTECLARLETLRAAGVTVAALDDDGVEVEAVAVLGRLRRLFAAERSARWRAARSGAGGRAGRPRGLTDTLVDQAEARIAAGETVGAVAAVLGVSRTTLHRYLARRREG